MKQHGPWKIKSSEVKYKNPWIEVREDQVIRPDGKDGIYGVIRMKDGVSVLPIDDANNVYLTHEFKYAVGRETIEVVSGAVDQGEAPLWAAKRELKEELGAEAREWIDLGSLDPFTAVIHSAARLFLAKDLKFTESHQEGTESLKLLKISFEEALEMVLKSEITHGQSCVLILKAARYLGKL